MMTKMLMFDSVGEHDDEEGDGDDMLGLRQV